MEQIFGLTIPQTLQETCHPQRVALLVYDMQIGILNQLPQERSQSITTQVLTVLNAARTAGIRIFFSRHLSLPIEGAGVSQLRSMMAWQRVAHVQEVKPWFLRDAPGFQLIPELSPQPSEVIFDKITMSAFEGTFLNLVLRDCGINAVMIVGVAMEVGIDPTVRHGADLGFIPVIVRDACGAGNEVAAQRSLASLEFAGDAWITDTATVCSILK